MVLEMNELFPRHPRIPELNAVRRNRTKDIVARKGVISPDNVVIQNHPIKRPAAIFNASAVLLGETLHVYARVVLGYYRYVSAIVHLEIPFHDVLTGAVSKNRYPAELVITPKDKHDFWGAEDPRVSVADNKMYMVYTGRPLEYFEGGHATGVTRAIVSASTPEKPSKWKRVGVVELPEPLNERVRGMKDAFVAEINNQLFLFHRVRLSSGEYHNLVGVIRKPLKDRQVITEPEKTFEVIAAAPFESKIGWGTPLVEVGSRTYVTILHGVDRETEVYRAFAALIEVSSEYGMPVVSAVTENYIMEPREVYEVYGDRPLVVFPCGLVRIDDELILIYGAADQVIGFGTIGLDHVMRELV